MHSFVYGLLGGLLIGIAAAALLILAGEMLGACGVVTSLALTPRQAITNPDKYWKLVFLASFCLTSNLGFSEVYEDYQEGLATLSQWAFALGGLLVGFGTKLGNGCTSGHGVCGLARFSKRSFVSVAVFMGVGMLTAYLTQASTSPFPDEAFAWLRTTSDDNTPPPELKVWPLAARIVVLVLVLMTLAAPTFHNASLSVWSAQGELVARRKLAPAMISGVIFAAGLYTSRMCFPVYVFGYLNLGLFARGGPNWDATLCFVMGGAVLCSAIAYQFIEGHSLILPPEKTLSKPMALTQVEGATFRIPTSTTIDTNLVLGGVCFGLGWGITGLCPGPAIFLASIGVGWVMVIYWPCFLFGSFIAGWIQQQAWLPCQATISCDGPVCENIPRLSAAGSANAKKEKEPLNVEVDLDAMEKHSKEEADHQV